MYKKARQSVLTHPEDKPVQNTPSTSMNQPKEADCALKASLSSNPTASSLKQRSQTVPNPRGNVFLPSSSNLIFATDRNGRIIPRPPPLPKKKVIVKVEPLQLAKEEMPKKGADPVKTPTLKPKKPLIFYSETVKQVNQSEIRSETVAQPDANGHLIPCSSKSLTNNNIIVKQADVKAPLVNSASIPSGSTNKNQVGKEQETPKVFSAKQKNAESSQSIENKNMLIEASADSSYSSVTQKTPLSSVNQQKTSEDPGDSPKKDESAFLAPLLVASTRETTAQSTEPILSPEGSQDSTSGPTEESQEKESQNQEKENSPAKMVKVNGKVYRKMGFLEDLFVRQSGSSGLLKCFAKETYIEDEKALGILVEASHPSLMGAFVKHPSKTTACVGTHVYFVRHECIKGWVEDEGISYRGEWTPDLKHKKAAWVKIQLDDGQFLSVLRETHTIYPWWKRTISCLTSADKRVIGPVMYQYTVLDSRAPEFSEAKAKITEIVMKTKRVQARVDETVKAKKMRLDGEQLEEDDIVEPATEAVTEAEKALENPVDDDMEKKIMKSIEVVASGRHFWEYPGKRMAKKAEDDSKREINEEQHKEQEKQPLEWEEHAPVKEMPPRMRKRPIRVEEEEEVDSRNIGESINVVEGNEKNEREKTREPQPLMRMRGRSLRSCRKKQKKSTANEENEGEENKDSGMNETNFEINDLPPTDEDERGDLTPEPQPLMQMRGRFLRSGMKKPSRRRSQSIHKASEENKKEENKDSGMNDMNFENNDLPPNDDAKRRDSTPKPHPLIRMCGRSLRSCMKKQNKKRIQSCDSSINQATEVNDGEENGYIVPTTPFKRRGRPPGTKNRPKRRRSTTPDNIFDESPMTTPMRLRERKATSMAKPTENDTAAEEAMMTVKNETERAFADIASQMGQDGAVDQALNIEDLEDELELDLAVANSSTPSVASVSGYDWPRNEENIPLVSVGPSDYKEFKVKCKRKKAALVFDFQHGKGVYFHRQCSRTFHFLNDNKKLEAMGKILDLDPPRKVLPVGLPASAQGSYFFRVASDVFSLEDVIRDVFYPWDQTGRDRQCPKPLKSHKVLDDGTVLHWKTHRHYKIKNMWRKISWLVKDGKVCSPFTVEYVIKEMSLVEEAEATAVEEAQQENNLNSSFDEDDNIVTEFDPNFDYVHREEGEEEGEEEKEEQKIPNPTLAPATASPSQHSLPRIDFETLTEDEIPEIMNKINTTIYTAIGQLSHMWQRSSEQLVQQGRQNDPTVLKEFEKFKQQWENVKSHLFEPIDFSNAPSSSSDQVKEEPKDC